MPWKSRGVHGLGCAEATRGPGATDALWRERCAFASEGINGRVCAISAEPA